jgi:hypothetical protein
VRVKKAELEVQEPREAHCKWRKTTKACLHICCTNRELGDRLGVLGNGRQMAVWISLDENHEIVDFFGVHSQFGSLCGDVVLNVIDKGVQDGHCLVGQTRVMVHHMHLFEYLVDV